jgi:hypothetical protein
VASICRGPAEYSFCGFVLCGAFGQGAAVVKVLGLVIVTAALAAPGALLAADDWRGWTTGDRMTLSVGVYEADMDTEATASEVNGLAGTPVNFEDDLGLDSSETALFASLNWRFLKRHELIFNYYDLDRDAADTTTEAIVFDGVIFPAGIQTDTEFDISVYEMSYSYSLIFDSTKNLYLGLGVSAQDLDFSIVSTDLPGLSTDDSFIVPMPTVNMGVDYAVTDSWLIGANLAYMNADVEISGDNIDAKVLLADAGLRWKPFRNLGFGLNYSLLHLDGEYRSDSVATELDLNYAGPRLTVDMFF